MMIRRQILLAGAGLAFLTTNSAGSAAISLVDISSLGKALGDAAEAVGKLGDSIAHLIVLGQQGWDAVSARKTRDRLQDISAKLTAIRASQRLQVVESLDDYIQEVRKNPSNPSIKNDWVDLVFKITTTLEGVKEMLTEIKNERSDFVTQSAYQELVVTLQERSNLLGKLIQMPAPVSSQEIDQLQIVSEKYVQLIDNLKAATDAINTYIHNLK